MRRQKYLGQNFLIEPKYLELEASFAHDTVLEIGPGTGNLTKLLCKNAEKVIAIEKDTKLAEACRRLNLSNLEIIEGDALKLDWPEADIVISNLPYSISSQLTFRIIEYGKPAILCYQKEFARRMVASVGTSNYGRLSVSVQAHADIELLSVVPKGCFRPIPEVDSQIVKLTPKEVDLPQNFDSIVNSLFQHRRKTVRNALRDSNLPEIDFPKRVFELTLDDIKEICEKLKNQIFK